MTPRLSIHFAMHLPLVELEPGVWVAPNRVEADAILADWKARWWKRASELGQGLTFRWDLTQDAGNSSPAPHALDAGVTSPAASVAACQNGSSGGGHILAEAEISEPSLIHANINAKITVR